MPSTTSDQTHLLRLMLLAAGRHDALKSFLDETLPEARASLPAGALAVVRSNPPKWELQAASGTTERDLPADLIGDAVDRENMVAAGDWKAASLGNGFALVARKATDPIAFSQFCEAL